jgi:hypothetical protein
MGPHRDPGEQAGVRRGRLLWFSRGAIADRRAYELRATTPPTMPNVIESTPD